MPALPVDEARHWFAEIGRVGRNAVMAEVHRIDEHAQKISDLTEAQREALRDAVAALP